MYGMHLADVETLSERVVCVRGLNPGEFTGPGTNTYVVGMGRSRVLIDAGDACHERYLTLLQATLDQHGARISQILVTHAHPDHLGGASAVAARLAAEGGCVVRKLPWGGHDGAVAIQPLTDGERVRVDEATSLRAVHTPGHSPDHLCFVLEEERALFSGDTILGAGTVVVPADGGSMHAYLDSLDRLRQLGQGLSNIYPGHGPPIATPPQVIDEYIAHRREREQQILHAVRRRDGAACSVTALVDELYGERRLSPPVRQAAAETCWNHLRRLRDQGHVACDGGNAQLGAQWQAVT